MTTLGPLSPTDQNREPNPLPLSTRLRDLAERLGVEPDYIDGRQEVHHATRETLSAVLRALDPTLPFEAVFQDDAVESTYESSPGVVEPVLVHNVQSGREFEFQMTIPVSDSVSDFPLLQARLRDEQGRTHTIPAHKDSLDKPLDLSVIAGVAYGRWTVRLPVKPKMGYYDLSLQVMLGDRSYEGHSFVIAAPRRCYEPSSRRKRWGVGLQLYSLRSRKNWGVGDLGDLRRIVKTAGEDWKADTIGVQPLHAQVPGLASPYSPSSRLYWNPLYLDMERVEEFRRSPLLKRQCRSKSFQQRLQRLRESALVEYEQVLALKLSVLESLFRRFRQIHLQKSMTRRGQAFMRFVEDGGSALRRFCTFQALQEHFGTSVWRNWPAAYQHPANSSVQDFQKKNSTRIRFHAYLQWLCELQLAELNAVAQKASLPLGLYQDLPVGIHPDGADAWTFQEQLATDISVGAPPDDFNLLGQCWGLLSPNPHSLRTHRYQFFIQTLRQNMRFARVLRIDHALGLFRMFWIPQGKSGRDGIYVRTFVDEILAILALESVRNQVMVVGEDLGTVTPVIRHKLESAGLLSYRLLFFERQDNGAFEVLSRFPEQALVAVTTHDLPTLRGYWAGRDITVKEEANLYPPSHDTGIDRAERGRDRSRLWQALDREGLAPDVQMPDTLSDDEVALFYRYLAKAPSRLLIVQVEDLLGEVETPNLPGASDAAYPSWRIKLHRPLESWLKDPEVMRFAQKVGRARRESSGNSRLRKRGKR
jgi:4-alpha-glucanotransferase